MDTSEHIICPSITVWMIFLFNIYFNYYFIFSIGGIIFQKDSDSKDIDMPSFRFMFSSLLINFFIELVASILVSLSFEKKNKRFYIIGLIMILVFDILMTIYIIISWIKFYKIFSLLLGKESKELNVPLALNRIFLLLINWIKFGVLMLYFNKVKSSLNNSDSSQGLISDFPNQIQPNE